MKSYIEYLTFNIPARVAFQNITPLVDAIVRKSGVAEGLLLCNAMHITASVFINDDESGQSAMIFPATEPTTPAMTRRLTISAW
jgi:thiamine phosphate synthase YjbQ (UPF0047 family)